jgi:hypothetical protein
MSVPGTLLALLFAAFAGVAQAVEFDEKIKAPMASGAADVKNRLASVAARLTGPNAVNALDAVRDRALARERFDARWMLGRLIDARTPLPELEALGFKSDGKGGYTIEGKDHPEWRPLTNSLLVFSDPSVVEKYEGTFIARGFRPDDYVALRNYVQNHDLKRARDQGQLALMISASKMARKLQKLRRLDDNFMRSLFYQKEWQFAEANRLWAVGLLDALEPRAQRILESYFTEFPGTSFISPTDTTAAYQYERELLLRPDFEQLARKAFEEGNL